MTEKSLFIFGAGYSALAIAGRAIDSGFSVSASCRGAEKKDLLKERGITPISFEEITETLLKNFTHILSSIPPQKNIGDIAIPYLPEDIGEGRWLGYLSTTGVYGNHDGAWVDENSPLYPDNDRLKRRVEAEKQWLARGGHIFRLSGIYGKGRSAIDDVISGKARRIYKEGQLFSRIHVDDIASVVLTSMLNPSPATIYNVCDDLPAAAHEVVEYACELLGKDPPLLIPFEQAEMSQMAREFYSANRRVKNDKIKRDLQVGLLYPDYREGLSAILQQMNA
ncbi:MAG: SDR family oxidoreductase [Rickettsiales bacterium]